jgi:hypothetical protein
LIEIVLLSATLAAELGSLHDNLLTRGVHCYEKKKIFFLKTCGISEARVMRAFAQSVNVFHLQFQADD